MVILTSRINLQIGLELPVLLLYSGDLGSFLLHRLARWLSLSVVVVDCISYQVRVSFQTVDFHVLYVCVVDFLIKEDLLSKHVDLIGVLRLLTHVLSLSLDLRQELENGAFEAQETLLADH